MSDFNSTHNSAGEYVNVIVPKSGYPVFGHTLVNSGQTISTVYSLSGNWLVNVSSWSEEGISLRAIFASQSTGGACARVQWFSFMN